MKKIKLFISDIDGTLTDGSFYYSKEGIALKKFNTKDGMGFELLRNLGVQIALLTGEIDPINLNRAKKIKVDYYFDGLDADGKLNKLNFLCKKLKINFEETSYIGDDINCLKILNAVSHKACPKDANHKLFKVNSIHITRNKGGDGAVREYIDFLIDKKLV